MDSVVDRYSKDIITVGQIVTEDPRKAEIFRKYDIDFCCGGKQPLAQACREKGLDVTKVQEELTSIDSSPADRQQQYDQWQVDFLADYIVNVHHSYLRDNIPLILELSDKIGRVHGENHPEAIEIARLFAEAAVDLQQHLVKEEQELFPYIKKLQQAAQSGEDINKSPYASATEKLLTYEEEHEEVGGILKQIRLLSNNFKLPDDVCNTYRVTYAKLDEFEQDIHQHIHLENNILFPGALDLERHSQS